MGRLLILISVSVIDTKYCFNTWMHFSFKNYLHLFVTGLNGYWIPNWNFTASYKHIKLIINFMKIFYYKKASLIQYPTDVYSLWLINHLLQSLQLHNYSFISYVDHRCEKFYCTETEGTCTHTLYIYIYE